MNIPHMPQHILGVIVREMGPRGARRPYRKTPGAVWSRVDLIPPLLSVRLRPQDPEADGPHEPR